MLEKEIAKLYGTLEFKANYQPLITAGSKLGQLEKQLIRLRKLATLKLNVLSGKTTLDIARQEAAIKKLAASRDAAIAASTAKETKAKLQIAKIEQQAFASKARGQGVLLRNDYLRQRNQMAASKAQLALQQAQVRLEQDKQRLVMRTSQQQLATARLQKFHTDAKARAERVAQRVKGSSSGHGFFRGAGSALHGAVGGIAGGSLPMVGMAGSGPVMALVALAAAATAAAAAIKSFGNSAVEAAQKEKSKMIQFEAIYSGDKELAKEENAEFLKFADKVGANAQQVAPDYARAFMGIKDADVSTESTRALVQGVMSLNTASGGGTESLQGAFRALTQMAGKGQVYSEEWTQQFAEHMPGAKRVGAMAWQQAIGGNLKGTAAQAAFSKDMADAKISGDMLKKFFDKLGDGLLVEANRGDRVAQMSTSHASMKNRQENAKNANLVKAYDANNGYLGRAQFTLDQSVLDMIKTATGLMDQLAAKAGDLNVFLAKATDYLTLFLSYLGGDKEAFDGLIDPKVLQFYEKLISTVKAGFNAVKGIVTLIMDLMKGPLGDALAAVANASLGVFREIFTIISEMVAGVRSLAEAIGLIKPVPVPTRQDENVTKGASVYNSVEDQEVVYSDDGIPLARFDTTPNGVPLSEEQLSKYRALQTQHRLQNQKGSAFQAKAYEVSKSSRELKTLQSQTVSAPSKGSSASNSSNSPASNPVSPSQPIQLLTLPSKVEVTINNNGLGMDDTAKAIEVGVHEGINKLISASMPDTINIK